MDNNTSTWHGGGTVDLGINNPFNGNLNLPVTVHASTNPPIGDNYKWQVYVTETGGGWSTATVKKTFQPVSVAA